MEQKKRLFVFLDLEFTQPSQRIIDIGACIVDLDRGVIVDEFQTFVNPEEMLTEYIQELTHITDDDLKNAPTFPMAWEQFINFLEVHQIKKEIFAKKKKKRVITWGSGDAPVIQKNAELHGIRTSIPLASVCDLKSVYSFLMLAQHSHSGGGLKKASQHMGITEQLNAHRALPDARQTSRLGIEIWKNLKRMGGVL